MNLYYKHLAQISKLVIIICSMGILACESSEKTEKTSGGTVKEDSSNLVNKRVKSDQELLDTVNKLTLDQGVAQKLILDASVEKEAVKETVNAHRLSKSDTADQSKKLSQKKKKKPTKCRRGIHKGRKKCKIERGHISLYHINRSKRIRDLALIDDKQRIIPEAREVMLELLGDWRENKQCKKGFSFNYDYQGRASWKMYRCYVQDRLLWYLYLVGHHFDSEIQIVSGLRAKERKSSRHHNGHAVDFKVAGVSAKKVWEYCKKTFPLVGVGYYPKTRFVHLDVGRDSHQAYWVDSSGSGESALYKRGVSQIQKGRARKSQAGMIKAIKRNLTRHYKSFKKKQKGYLERKKRAENRRKRRKKRKRSRSTKKK